MEKRSVTSGDTCSNGSDSDCNNSIVARRLWRRLGDAVKQHSLFPNDQYTYLRNAIHSKEELYRCENIGLINWEEVDEDDDNDWWRATFQNLDVSFSLLVTFTSSSVNAFDLVGFDNTGTVRIWAGEQVLAYWCVRSLKNELTKWEKEEEIVICELAGGMTCLAGLALALSLTVQSQSQSFRIVLTDGNEKCVQTASLVAGRNLGCSDGCGNVKVDNRVLKFGCDQNTVGELCGKVDVVIAADCFFLDDVHSSLLKTLNALLKPGGLAFFVAPDRAGSFGRFVDLATASSTGFQRSSVDFGYADIFEEFIRKTGMDTNDNAGRFPRLLTLVKSSDGCG